MRSQQLWAPCLVVTVGALIAASAHAAPTGTFTLAGIPQAAIGLSATRIDFLPPPNPPSGAAGAGDFSQGGGSVVPYSGGVVTSATNPYGAVADVDVAGGSVANFVQLYVGSTLPPPGTGTRQTYPAFDLTGLVPGGGAQGALDDCDGVVAIGVSCSPAITPGGGSPFVSPLVLVSRGDYTEISFGVRLLGRDAVGSAVWVGGFSMQVTTQSGTRLTPDAIQDILNAGGSISCPYSAAFAAPTAPPIAEAGPDQVVIVGAQVQLDGSGSSDPYGSPLAYSWTLVATPPGSLATLADPTGVQPTFTADVVGTYQAQLIVDNGSASSAADTVTITALPPPWEVPALDIAGIAAMVLLLAAAAMWSLRRG